MASYRISWRKSTKKDLRKIQKKDIARIIEVVESLAQDPYQEGAIKLTGSQFTYRIRVGDYRILYEVCADAVHVEIVRIAHRSNIYKNKG